MGQRHSYCNYILPSLWICEMRQILPSVHFYGIQYNEIQNIVARQPVLVSLGRAQKPLLLVVYCL
jgi:hypothetical protein